MIKKIITVWYCLSVLIPPILIGIGCLKLNEKKVNGKFLLYGILSFLYMLNNILVLYLSELI